MSKDMKKVAESAEKSTNTVFNAMVDGIGEHISQLEESAEKGKETAKKVGELILDGIGTVIDAAADSIAGVVNGEGIDLEKEKDVKEELKKNYHSLKEN